MINSDNNINTFIASAAERSITSQTELLSTLSFTLIAGLLAMILQVRISNAGNGNSEITIRRFYLAWCAMGCAALSILLGYLISGMFIEMAPQLFSHMFDLKRPFSEQDYDPAPFWLVRVFSLSQFIVFLAAIIFGTLFVVFNREPGSRG